MYIIVDKDTNIVISVDNTHSKAVSSLQNFMEESSYEVTPSIGQKFIKETNSFRDLSQEEHLSAREVLLKESDWMTTRHRDQVDSGDRTTLTEVEYSALLTYKQQLRDITVGEQFPLNPLYLKTGVQ